MCIFAYNIKNERVYMTTDFIKITKHAFQHSTLIGSEEEIPYHHHSNFIVV